MTKREETQWTHVGQVALVSETQQTQTHKEQTDRQTNRQTDRQTDRQTNRLIDKQIDREIGMSRM
ncbi:hypothetical protein X777_04668 [Ooceraea biroi]|uniref:Uncharacterized protein n=1 Tax=Ooceraea biroi TaxID=2015173 RepID=A0A026X0P3_OOCBI|nr:hypothetical protein X777_04668 [Ooceraea biroi]